MTNVSEVQNEDSNRAGNDIDPGETITVFKGASARTFKIELRGTVTGAEIVVTIDGAQGAVMSQNNRVVFADGTDIRLSNRGNRTQLVVFAPV